MQAQDKHTFLDKTRCGTTEAAAVPREAMGPQHQRFRTATSPSLEKTKKVFLHN
jgi:hypothetical protein